MVGKSLDQRLSFPSPSGPGETLSPSTLNTAGSSLSQEKAVLLLPSPPRPAARKLSSRCPQQPSASRTVHVLKDFTRWVKACKRS